MSIDITVIRQAAALETKNTPFYKGVFVIWAELLVGQPFFGFGGGETLDVFLGVLGIGTAADVEEELAAFGFEQAFFIAGRIAVRANRHLIDELGGFGIVFYFANDLLHGDIPFFLPQ